MSYTLIKGSFHIHYPESPLSGPEPDGDTLKFQPDNIELIRQLPRSNFSAKFNKSGMTSIRFEAIDALETHFSVAGEKTHQHFDLAIKARDALLEKTGFGDVHFFPERPFKVERVENHPVRGYVLSNGLDTYGRTIAFVYVGDTPVMDGAQIFITPEMLGSSLNHFMLAAGHAYPAFYLSLPRDLREHFRPLVKSARAAGAGLWAQSQGNLGNPVAIRGLDHLQELVIWPKLFRRLVPFYLEGNLSLSAFNAWLRLEPKNRDDRLLLPSLELGNMHDLIAADGINLQMLYHVEDLVIVPDDYRLAEPIDHGMSNVVYSGGEVRIVAALINALAVDEARGESVTLLNTTTLPMDLTGWTLTDNHNRQELSGVIEPGDAVRVKLDRAVRLNNERDAIGIVDPQGKMVDRVSYDKRDVPQPGHTKVF